MLCLCTFTTMRMLTKSPPGGEIGRDRSWLWQLSSSLSLALATSILATIRNPFDESRTNTSCDDGVIYEHAQLAKPLPREIKRGEMRNWCIHCKEGQSGGGRGKEGKKTLGEDINWHQPHSAEKAINTASYLPAKTKPPLFLLLCCLLLRIANIASLDAVFGYLYFSARIIYIIPRCIEK